MSLLLYNLFLILYKTAIRFASIWDGKARLWIDGRKQPIPNYTEKTIWMHCASLGEFEQGRTVLETIKKQYPQYKVVLTFFSPSGYTVRKNYPEADSVLYLPLDSPQNAKKFINAINPALVLWVKYEYWYYHLTELQKNNIPVILVSGIFRPNQPFFKWYGKLWKKMLQRFSVLFVQNEKSLELLKEHGLNENAIISGDTRFDRVSDILKNPQPNEKVEKFCGSDSVIVAGSTWEEDQEVLAHYVHLRPDVKFIIAPHEVDEDNILDVLKQFPDALRFTKWNGNDTDAHVLIIDNIGMLSRLYKYATIAYIGGGFRDSGIHNTLEAAVYGIPVVFGPVYEKFKEAVELIDVGAAVSIESAIELEETFNDFLNNAHKITMAGSAAKEYVSDNKGASKIILDYIQRNRLLTN